MSNTLTAVQNKILARALLVLRRKVILPTLVNSDYSMEARKKGDVVNVPIAAAGVASAVTPSNTSPVPSQKTPTSVAIPLSTWNHSDFGLNDEEMARINAQENFLPMQANAAAVALAEQLNADIFAAVYPNVYGYVGTAGTTPFGTADVLTDATNLFKTLNVQLCPKGQRRVVLDFAAEASALAQRGFRDAAQTGKNSVIIEGEVGRFFGMDWYSDNQVPTHTTGAATGYLVNNGAGYAIGTTTLVIDTGTGAWVDGDIITFAGHTQTYAVSGTSTTTSLVLKNALVAAVVDNEAITKKASHTVNLAFHRDAIAVAIRPLDDSSEGNPNISTLQDPQTGLVLRLERIRQYKQWSWDLDILYGVKLLRPELACRLAG